MRLAVIADKGSNMRLNDLEEDATEKLRDYIIEQPDASLDELGERINDIASDLIPMMTADMLSLALNDLWLAVESPEYVNDGDTPYDLLVRNVDDHLTDHMHEQLEAILGEVTTVCDGCNARMSNDGMERCYIEATDTDDEKYLCQDCAAKLPA